MYLKSIILVLLYIMISNNLSATKRVYVWTYEYQIQERNSWELEYYNTIATLDASNFKGNTSVTHQVELEIGMSERFDIALYQVFTSNPENGINYNGFKFRTRFIIGEKNEFLMDPLIYLEYKGVPDFDKHIIEMKFILSKDYGDFNVSLNPYFEIEKEGALSWEFIPKYALGISYSLTDLFNFGIESKGSSSGYYLGPTIAHGSETLWFGISPFISLGKVADGKPEFYLRMIIAFGG